MIYVRASELEYVLQTRTKTVVYRHVGLFAVRKDYGRKRKNMYMKEKFREPILERIA